MTTRHSTKKWYHYPMVWLLVSIPAVSVVLGIVIVSIAVNTDTSLVVDDYYKKGKTINLRLERDNAANKMNINATLELNKKTDNLKLVLGKLPEENLADLKMVLFHPTKKYLDRKVALRRLSSTSNQVNYTALLPPMVNGKWYIQLETENWRLMGTIQLPEQKIVLLKPAKH